MPWPQNARNSPAGRKNFFSADDPRRPRSARWRKGFSAVAPCRVAAPASGGSAPVGTPAPSRLSGTSPALSARTTSAPPYGTDRCNSASVHRTDRTDARTPSKGKSANAGNRRELALPVEKNHLEGGPRRSQLPKAHAPDESLSFIRGDSSSATEFRPPPPISSTLLPLPHNVTSIPLIPIPAQFRDHQLPATRIGRPDHIG